MRCVAIRRKSLSDIARSINVSFSTSFIRLLTELSGCFNVIHQLLLYHSSIGKEVQIESPPDLHHVGKIRAL
jgi:hypothetical protein